MCLLFCTDSLTINKLFKKKPKKNLSVWPANSMTVYRTVLPDHCGLVTSDRREFTLSSFVLLHINVTVHIKQCVLCHPPTPHTPSTRLTVFHYHINANVTFRIFSYCLFSPSTLQATFTSTGPICLPFTSLFVLCQTYTVLYCIVLVWGGRGGVGVGEERRTCL